MNRVLKESIWKSGFKPTESATQYENLLRAKLGLSNRYDSARLAIGRSLAEISQPVPVPSDASFGKPIAGEQLFGEEIDLWICALVMDGDLGDASTLEDFRLLVEAHWARGVDLLREEFERCNQDESKFLSLVADFLPETGEELDSPNSDGHGAPGEIAVSVGTISKSFETNEKISLIINAPGTSPHIALMGKISSGKTTTGVQIAAQIVQKAEVPILFIDPKGEFVSNSRLSGRLADLGIDIEPIEVGVNPIPLDFLPSPEVGSASIQNAAMGLRDSIALCCKGAGDIQKDLLRIAIEKVIRHAQPRSLENLRDYYRTELESQNKGHDSILSRLNELTSLQCFSPVLGARDFFRRSYVLSLKALGTEELKRLVILLVLDSLKFFLLQQDDAPLFDGYRTLRHLLVVDEARRILSEKKYQSLVDIVRQGRSKGSVVMLLSQDPSDFDGQADDFTTQLGTVISFACSQTQQGLRALQGVYGRKVQPKEFSDTWLGKGIAFAKLPNRPPERIVCWE